MASAYKYQFAENGAVSSAVDVKSDSGAAGFRSARYYPVQNFAARKWLVWLIMGPLNPVFWALTFPLTLSFNPFNMVGFLTFWPCSLGMALLLWRLQRAPIATGKLTGMAFGWAFSTIVWYTFAIAVIVMASNVARSGFSFEAIMQVFGVALFLLPFAAMIGALPAIFFAIVARLICAGLLYRDDIDAQDMAVFD